MRGPVNMPKNFDPNDKKYRKFAHELPTRDKCDLDDPEEMFLWMLVALPGMNGGQQAMPSSYNRLVSAALYRRGAMLKCENCGHMKAPEEVYVPPDSEDPHWMTSPGRWVPPDEAPKREVDPMDDALDKLTNQQQAALLERLKRRHEEGRI